MIKKSLLLLLFVYPSFLFPLNTADQKISENIFNVYGDDITLEQIKKVLEFDEDNRAALVKKADYMDSYDISLYLIKEILESSDTLELESKIHYISILYRLKLYNELILFSENIDLNRIDGADTLYFVSDSYIRMNEFEKSGGIILLAKHQFPNDVRFLELEYLIDQDRSVLSKIEKLHNPLQSYIRLYNRIEAVLPRLTLEVLIENKLVNLDKKTLGDYVGNYALFKPLLTILSTYNLTGYFSLDVDSDTFSDTYIKVKNGIIQYKGYDRNRDNIVDYEIFVEDGTPRSIVVDGNILTYGEYPFIDYISILGEDRITYNLYKNFSKKELTTLISPNDLTLILKQIPKLKTISKIYYKNDKPYMKSIFKDENTMLIYSEVNEENQFDKCLYIKNDTILAGLRDLNSDGIFDLSEVYVNGIIVGSAYSFSGNKDEITFVDSLNLSKELIIKRSNFEWANQ